MKVMDALYKHKFDFDREYGIVLEGGGAKGAYQIGVWKALEEYGVKIKGIAGVSVGALNGALIAMGDYDFAESIWKQICYSKVMNVDDATMDKLIKLDMKNLHISNLTRTSAKTIVSGGVNIQPLRDLIDECVNEEKIRQSEKDLYIGTFSVTNFKEMELKANELETGTIKDYLIASCSLPVFKREKFQGKSYLDGGIINNVPIDMLLKNNYKNIIVVRIFGLGLEKRVKIPKDVTVLEIAPRIDLGNILEFNHNKIVRNIKIGYYDAVRLLRGLIGKIYYIESFYSEKDYCAKFMNVNTWAMMAWLEYFKLDYSREEYYVARFFDTILPNIATALGIAKDWNYEELYISILELSAKQLRIQKYRVYSVEELLSLVRERYNKRPIEEKKDLFVDLVIKTITIIGE